ncbi:hypothetical protein OK016_17590 [Vibrio chagasii]|nr:hypothetical protein [Vibrio chagasii]
MVEVEVHYGECAGQGWCPANKVVELVMFHQIAGQLRIFPSVDALVGSWTRFGDGTHQSKQLLLVNFSLCSIPAIFTASPPLAIAEA